LKTEVILLSHLRQNPGSCFRYFTISFKHLQSTNWPTFPCYVRFFSWPKSPSRPRPPLRGSLTTLRHTTCGRTPLDDQSARRRNVQVKTQSIHKRQTSISPAGFEPAIPASERQ